jgi:hypothetical protein
MKVNVQHHSPAALSPGEELRFPFYRVGLDAGEKRKISWGGHDDTEFEIKATRKGKGSVGVI